MTAAPHATTVKPAAAPPEQLAREALIQLADRVADRLNVPVIFLVEPGPSRSFAIMRARWTFVWAARIVLHARDWQVADLVGWSRDQVREFLRALHEEIDRNHVFRDQLDLTVRRFFADTAWKRPLKAAIKAHFLATDGRRL